MTMRITAMMITITMDSADVSRPSIMASVCETDLNTSFREHSVRHQRFAGYLSTVCKV